MTIDMETGERLDLQPHAIALGALHELEQDRRIDRLEKRFGILENFLFQLLQKEKDNGNSKSSEDRV